MTTLSIFQRPQITESIKTLSDFNEIQALLAGAGIRFERWDMHHVPDFSNSQQVLAHFQPQIEQLKQQEGYTAADVVALTPTHPERIELRQKFLQEHTHSEDEVRLFIHGSGTFFVPLGKQVIKLVCQKGDLLRVPANTPHWFDSGEFPDFVAIRIFTNPEGWVGHFTGRETFH